MKSGFYYTHPEQINSRKILNLFFKQEYHINDKKNAKYFATSGFVNPDRFNQRFQSFPRGNYSISISTNIVFDRNNPVAFGGWLCLIRSKDIVTGCLLAYPHSLAVLVVSLIACGSHRVRGSPVACGSRRVAGGHHAVSILLGHLDGKSLTKGISKIEMALFCLTGHRSNPNFTD